MSDFTEKMTLRRQTALPRGLGNLTPFFVSHAEGAMMWDVDGREYIDFAGGIGVNNIGHRHPAIVASIKSQVDRVIHSCAHVMLYEPYLALAEELNRIIPCRGSKKSFFLNSGAEAVENAVKIARYHTGRPGVVCFEGAFHGRTLLGMTLTSKVMPYKFKLGALTSGVYRAHYPYCYRCPWGKAYPSCNLYCGEDYFETNFFKYHVAPEEVGAIIIEPILGEGGFINPPVEYLGHIRRICDRHGIVMIVDEVQSGFARTGKLFACENFQIEADIITTAKSLAGGLPLSGVTGTAEIMDSVHPGGVGSTYGGNPLACQAALEVIHIIEAEDLVGRSAEIGEKVRGRFEELKEKYEIIGDVRGLGAMLALELVKDRRSKTPAAEEAKKISAYCHQNGLIILDCGTLGNNLRTLMPLIITEDQLEKGLAILEDAFVNISG